MHPMYGCMITRKARVSAVLLLCAHRSLLCEAHVDDADVYEPAGPCFIQVQIGMHRSLTFGREVSERLSPSSAGWFSVWATLVVTLLMVLPLVVRILGGLPQERKAEAAAKATRPPAGLLWITGIVCVGIMANFTVVLPTAESTSSSLVVSGYVIASYSVGGLLGLFFFRMFGIDSLRRAYMLHAVCMIVGNLLYAHAAARTSDWMEVVGRVITGFEGGCMYTTGLAIVHFARGSNKTAYLVLYQFFVAIGVLLGPMLTSFSLGAGANATFANYIFAVWGIGMLALVFLFIPSDISELEVQAGIDPEQRRAPVDQTLQVATANELEDTGSAAGPGTALMVTLLSSAFVRMLQRLLWESGSVVAVSHSFGWSSESSGGMFATVVICQALGQFAFSKTLAGACNDATLMRFLEFGQLLGVGLMFEISGMPSSFNSAKFVLASIIAYCCNALWAGVCNSVCLKRALPGTLFCLENLLVLNQAAIFIGMALGSILSRYAQDLAAGINSLAATLLAGGLLQAYLSVVAMGEVSLDFVALIMSTVVGAAIAIGALTTSFGGTGPGNVFTWHLVCMGLAWPCVGIWGFWAYRAGVDAEKNRRRTLHMVCMLSALILSALGYYFIWKAHHDNGEGQFGGLVREGGSFKLDRGVVRFLHVLIGYFVISGTMVQVPLGLLKRWVLLSTSEKMFTWHGKFGKLLLVAALAATCVGTWIDFNSKGSWPMPLKAGLTAGLVGLAVLTTWSESPSLGKSIL
eukprot:TRINITY_DN108130_c0_g1_i1.p1 TRINITY_DN108130_c0_g1~~TRINITY_DN108130_c0_g1_i1.p1  ORF type:complete len:747 (+),score=111.31 TRINITY_DN108130_c0_g1_i1:64-2304(+)